MTPRRERPTPARLATAAWALLGLGGCAALQDPPTTRMQVDGWDVMTASAERQLAIIRRADQPQDLLCLAPDPDGLATHADHVSVNLSGAATSEGMGAATSEGAVALGGRSAHVLLAREVFYRTCELTLNQRLPQTAALALFREALSTVAPAFVAPDVVTAQAGVSDDDDENDDDLEAAARAPAAAPAMSPAAAAPTTSLGAATAAIAPLVGTSAAQGDF